jgi:O-acetyl-ADP-ribose deacetylase (regulator of RNase III)
MQIVLATPDAAMAAAWSEAFSGTDASIYNGSILEVQCDALVSPANSFGFMDGGLDLAYSQHFGWELQMRLRRQILERHGGELLVGAAELVETGRTVPGLMIAAPTMRVPMRLPEDSVNAYLSTRAALLAAREGRLPDGTAASSRITVLSVPAMGTGVGRMSAKVSARQMRAAYDAVITSPAKLPTSWAEASYDHQLLYTSKPRRLQ